MCFITVYHNLSHKCFTTVYHSLSQVCFTTVCRSLSRVFYHCLPDWWCTCVDRSALPLRLDQWHVVRASRTGMEGVLQVDDGPEVKGQSRGAYTQLTLLQNLFLGGHHNFDHTSKHANVSSSFVGCIQKVGDMPECLLPLLSLLPFVSLSCCQH